MQPFCILHACILRDIVTDASLTAADSGVFHRNLKRCGSEPSFVLQTMMRFKRRPPSICPFESIWIGIGIASIASHRIAAFTEMH